MRCLWWKKDASGLYWCCAATKGHPIAFISKTLAQKHHSLSTYEKEFLVVIQALDKWKGYLLDRHFIIKTDHFSLKYLLGQRITTITQIKWLPKLIGYDYEIMYKKGSKNVVADALSRVQIDVESLQISVTTLSSALYDKIKQGSNIDSELPATIEKLEENPACAKH